MMYRKILAMLLTAGMAAGLLAGCGSSGEAELEGSAQESEYSDEDITEIELYTMTLYDDSGLEEVEVAVNEISEKEIGVHVNMTYLDMGAYAQQVGLMFSSGEPIDLMITTPIPSAGFSSMVSQNQLQPLNDLLPEYAPELYDLMEEYLSGTTVDGNIYSVTVYRTLNSNGYVLMRKDILEDLGLLETAKDMTSWTDYESILQALLDSNFDGGKVTAGVCNTDQAGTVMTTIYEMIGNDDWSENYSVDTLGDTYKIIAVDEETNTVYDYFESEDYYNMLRRVDSWYEAGYVYKDAMTSEDSATTLLTNDVTFSAVTSSEIGAEESYSLSTGKDITATQIIEEKVSTGSSTKFSWAVPTTATEPQAAVEFLNLLYTNEEINNLMAWGIEGRDYELNEEGEAVKLDDGLYQYSDFLVGNQFLCYPANGQGGDFRERSEESLKTAELSKYFGCAVGTANISNELTAVNNVIEQYKPGYESGTIAVPDTYEEYYNGEFCTALRSAGVDTVIAEYQAQLDEWLASK